LGYVHFYSDEFKLSEVIPLKYYHDITMYKSIFINEINQNEQIHEKYINS